MATTFPTFPSWWSARNVPITPPTYPTGWHSAPRVDLAWSPTPIHITRGDGAVLTGTLSPNGAVFITCVS